MDRGRPSKVSEDRLLVELHLVTTPAFASDVAENIQIGTQQTRDKLNKMSEADYVSKREASGRNLYDLTDAGENHVAKLIRDAVI